MIYKQLKMLYTIFGVAFVCSRIYAGGIVTNINQSAQFIRMLSRNASTEIDAVYFNPAGLALLVDGVHLSLNNQTIFQEKTIESTFPYLNSKSYVGDVTIPLFPSFFAAYKKGKVALSLGFGPNGGGGSAEYNTGLPSFEMPPSMLPTLMTSSNLSTNQYNVDLYFKGSSIYWGTQVNATYAIIEMLSVSAGVRIINAKNTYEGHLKNIQVNPDHPLNPNGAGNLTGANQFFTTLAAASYSAAGTAGKLKTAGLPDLETARDGNAITAEQYAQLKGGLGANYTAGMSLEKVEALYKGTGDVAAENAVKTRDMLVDASQKGFGITPIFGAHVNLFDKLKISVKYEVNTTLELKNKADSTKDANDMFKNDSTFRNDIPAILSVGVEYGIMENFRVSGSWTHYFDKNANWDGKEKLIDKNLYELALGLEFDVSEMIILSAGYMHGQTGVGQGYQTDISFSNSTNSVAFGGRINVNEKLSVDLGALFTVYTSASEDKTFMEVPFKETYNKKLTDFAIGLNYTF